MPNKIDKTPPSEAKTKETACSEYIDRSCNVTKEPCSLNGFGRNICPEYKNTERPNINEYFLEMAQTVARRSTCLRHKVGAVLVKDKQILTTGYNGAPRNLPHCLDTGCIRDKNNIPSGTMHEICRAIHAEQNAVIQAALHGVSTEGATLYCTHQPCVICAKILINAGIAKVVFAEGYPDDEAISMMKEAGVGIELTGKKER